MVNGHRKGSRWRRDVELWLQRWGFTTMVRGLGYAGDDIGATRGRVVLSVEAKNTKTIDLAGAVDQAVSNAPKGAIPVVAIHRRNRGSANDGYVVMPGWALMALLELATHGTPCDDTVLQSES